ncbi:hypothetical protein ACIQ7D_00515 [Streptomyces sp. NPDC096310]|uniref:hypothetical protein n=1 Tax=Streptomyces sp. NPDC096310 TaxID=3366082 RepID=UPI003800E34C
MAYVSPPWRGTERRFDVNLSILFTELPLLERPVAAGFAAGFAAATGCSALNTLYGNRVGRLRTAGYGGWIGTQGLAKASPLTSLLVDDGTLSAIERRGS